MALANQIEFQVDEQYENEKGVFTVISIHRSEMVIRWENGEEIRTDIELQRNIQARRQWEEMNRKAQAAKKSSAANKNAGFPGFMPGDFKHTASGTKWRGRAQLGGEVAALMPADRFNFNSWAFAQKPELHWLDTKHRRSAGAGRGARFFCKVDTGGNDFRFLHSQNDRRLRQGGMGQVCPMGRGSGKRSEYPEVGRRERNDHL